jgi:hypothetical protein
MSDTQDMRNDRMQDPEMTGEAAARQRDDMGREPMTGRDDTKYRGATMNRDEEMNRDDEISREDARERDRERMDASARNTTTEPATASRATMPARTDGETQMWPEMGDLRQRFDAIQSEFIEDPKGAVNKAEGLVKELVDRITRSMNERMNTMHRGVENTNDTEQLRQTMRGYRELVVWMETRRAA